VARSSIAHTQKHAHSARADAEVCFFTYYASSFAMVMYLLMILYLQIWTARCVSLLTMILYLLCFFTCSLFSTCYGSLLTTILYFVCVFTYSGEPRFG